MKLRSLFIALLLALFSFQTLNITAFAEEGMWPFNNIPRAEIKKKYGFDITDEWLNKVRLASVRFNNGGSGSFVSPNGLVLTNHHIVEDIVGEVSTPEKDLAKEGFLARTQAEEIKAPSLELNQLISIEDVTARVNGAVKPGATDAESFAARRAEISAIEAESAKATGLRSDVVTLYQGGQYNLYRYKKYTDVRLVFVPEFQAAFFGGDPDNFNFPRFDIDMALVRVYENDQPVHPENYFKWSITGAKEGSLVFVTGNPGSTSRLDTVAHLEELRDNSIPILIRLLERREAVLLKYMALGEEQKRQAQNELDGVQNSLKVYRGQLAGLKDTALMTRKMKEEAALRKSIAANPEREKLYGDAWDAIAKAHKTYPTYIRERRIFDMAGGFNSVLFGFARTLVRLADENPKPNNERLPEYTDARRASLELALYSPAPIHEDFEKLKMADSLGFMVELLGADHPLVKQVLDGKTPEERAEELISGTKLDDPAYRKELAAGGKKAIEESTDPMIVVARLIDPKARELRKRYESEVTGVERANYAKIARALFETEGTKLYPDATFTLRLSYGTVAGYIENGKKIPPFTTLGGLYARSDAFKRQFPYNLPQRWYDKKSALDLSTPFNFVSTNDIIGGNSGSPTINQNGELVGLIFDGNIQSLVGDFIYDPSVNRAISVDSRGMLEVMKKIFNANELVAELTSQAATTRAAGR
ncbi:MAG TPA: S46 family peptidase [Pyrinomonadaceae bacterium]|nr:S46 family peptidase [Pyrinomonadaceae bacterium]